MRCRNMNKHIRTVLVVTAILLFHVNAQITNVTARDPRIDYVGDWVDQDSGGHKFTNTLGSSLSFTFQGSAIFWYSTKDPNGGVASVSVDSDSPHIVDASAGAVKNGDPVLEVMFSQSNLDSSKEHTFNITYVGPGALGGPYVTIYLLAFSTDASSAPDSAPQSSNPVQTQETTLHNTVTASFTHTVTTVAQRPSDPTTTAKNLSPTVTSSTSFSSSTNIRASPTTSVLASIPFSNFSDGATPSVVGGAVGTQSSSPPLPSSSDIAGVLHASQRMNTILAAVLGPIGGILLIGAIVLLLIWLRYRKKHRLRQGDAAPLFTREVLTASPSAAPLFTREVLTASGLPFTSKMGTTRPRLPPSIQTNWTGLSDAETSIPPENVSTSSRERYIGQGSESDFGTSPPEYTA